jgi:hypothetical protein
MIMSPAGLGPLNDCAGEGQHATVNYRPILSSGRMLHKNNNSKFSVGFKNLLVVSLKGLLAKTN